MFYTVLALLAGTAGLIGCASSWHRNTESLLSASGFHSLTPRSPEQRACYAAMPPFQVQRQEINGKVIYAYADKDRGIVYVGNENNYQRLQQLALQQQIAHDQFEAAQMNQESAMNWGFWGPAGIRW